MASLLRTVLVATALLSSGVLQVAASTGDDDCCAGETEEKDAPCPECPPGLACGCCPVRVAVDGAEAVFAPAAHAGVAIVAAVTEPVLGSSVTDIFHPPKA